MAIGLLLGQYQIDPIVRKDEAAGDRCDRHRDRDGAHAGINVADMKLAESE